MRKNFIKCAVLILAAFFTSNAMAQNEKGDIEIGADFNVGIGASEFAPKTFFGGGIKGRWTLADNFRLEANASYMIVSETNEWETEYYDWDEKVTISHSEDVTYGLIDISVNAHYLFGLTDGLFVYPLAGLGIVGATDAGNTEANASAFALNLGAGAQYMFNENWGANVEAKYKILTGDAFSYINFSLGVIYKLP